MSVPIICLGCNERAEIPFIPADLTCVACKTGEHIDLDDLSVEAASQTCPECGGSGKCDVCGGTGKFDPEKSVDRSMGKGAMLDDLPMMLLPSGVPDEDRDMPLLDEDGTKRKVTVPKGSAPYTQRALASRLDPKSAGVCSTCHGAGAVPAGGGEDPSEVDNGYVKCPACYGHGTDAFEEDDRLSEKDWHDPMDDPKQELSGWWSEGAKSASLTKSADLHDIRGLLAQFNGKNVTVTYDDDLGLHTVAGPLVYHPPAVMVGKSATTDVHVLQVTVNGYGDWPDERTESTGSPSPLDYAHIGPSAMASKTAGQHQWQSDGVVGGHKTYCSFPGGHGPGEECPTDPREDGARMGQPSRAWRADHPNQTANPQRTKVALIADAVQESNPGMDRKAALRIARKTVQRYPKVAAAAVPGVGFDYGDKVTHPEFGTGTVVGTSSPGTGGPIVTVQYGKNDTIGKDHGPDELTKVGG